MNGPSIIEGCYLEGEIQLEGENILTGIPKGTGNIKLQKGICVTCLPVHGTCLPSHRQAQTGIPIYNRMEGKEGEYNWVSIIYGIEDDFKKCARPSREAGLAEDDAATFLNDTFLRWMEEKGISLADLWKDNEPHELWNARLFSFSIDPAESMQISLSFQDEKAFHLDRWKASPRMSLQEILQAIDYERFLSNYSNLCQKINLENLATILTPKSNLSSEEILSWCVEADDYNTAIKMTLALIEQSEDILFQARLYKLLNNITKKAGTRN